MDLGININTKDGIDKANKEIKDWLNNLQSDIDKNKLKISFDMPKDLEKYMNSLSKASGKMKVAEEAATSLKGQLSELEELWGLLSAEERRGLFGAELREEWKSLSEEAMGLDSTLRQAVKTVDSMIKKKDEAAEAAGLLSTKIKNLEQEWSKLNERERQSDKGDALKSKYKALTESAGGYTSTLKSAVAQEEKMQQELKRSADAEKKKQQALEKQASYLKTYKGQLEELERQWAKLNAEQRKGAEGQQVIAKVKKLNESYGEYKGTLSQVIAEEQRHEVQLKKSGKAMSQLKNIAASYLSVYMGIRLTKQIADITGEFEMQKNAIAAMLNNTERAETIFKQIKTLAVVSPFEVKDLVSYAKQLTAFSVPYEELYDTTKRLADISAGLGVDMGRLILAFGQVRSSAVLRGQELRQFTEAGIPLIDELVRKFKELGEEGITTADIFDKIYTRQVPFEMVRDVMFEMTEEGGKFYQMQEVQADTLKGKITNLADAYDIFLAEIGEKGSSVMGGFVDFLKDIMENYQALTVAVLAGATAFGIGKMAMAGFADSLLTAAVSAEKLWLTLRKNPWGLIAAAITGATYYLVAWYKEANKVTKAHKEMMKSMGDLKVRVETESEVFKTAVNRLKSATEGTKEYEQAKNNISKKYGKYLEDLGLELTAITKNTNAYKLLEKAILKASMAQASVDFTEQMTASFSKQKGEAWVKVMRGLMKTGISEPVAQELLDDLKAQASQMEEDKKVSIFNLDNVLKAKDISKSLSADVRRGLNEYTQALGYYIEQDKNRLYAFGEFASDTDDNVTEGRIHNIHKLLKELEDFERELKELQAPAWDKDTDVGVGDKDREKIKSLNEDIARTKSALAELGYEEPKKTGAKKVDEELRNMLARMRKDIDDYTRQVNIWEALQKPYDKSLETFLSEQLKELGISLGSGSVLDMEWRNIILGKDLKPEVEDMARSIFNTLRDNALKARQESEKELKELTDKYATYSEKIAQINAKYQKDIDSMRAKGMSDEQVNEALRKQSKELDDFINTHVKGTDDFAVFLAEVAGKGLGELVKLSEQIEKEMADVAKKFGTNSEVYQVLRAMITELNKLKEEAADKSDDESSKIYQNWRRVQSVLNNVNKNFRDIESSIGGLSGEAIGVIGEVTNATLSSMNAVETVFEEAGLKISEISVASIQALTGVQKASIALTVLSTAIKAITKIGSFITNAFNAKHNREIKKQKEAIEQLQKEYKVLQQEIKKAYGSDYFRTANREIENLRKQQEALNKQLDAENKKSGKKAKKNAKELENEILDTTHAIEDSISDMVERMAGTSLANAANSFADAWLDAYYSFEDTSLAIEGRFREMARNMIREAILAGIAGKHLQPIFDYVEKELQTDEGLTKEKLSVLNRMMGDILPKLDADMTNVMDWMEGLEFFGRGKGESNLTGIAKGIANASEDTVLLVGGYLDSIRFKLFPYIDFMMGEYSSTINLIMNAQIQQVNHLREIEAATRDTSRSNRELVDAINSVIEVGDNGKRLKV